MMKTLLAVLVLGLALGTCTPSWVQIPAAAVAALDYGVATPWRGRIAEGRRERGSGRRDGRLIPAVPCGRMLRFVRQRDPGG